MKYEVTIERHALKNLKKFPVIDRNRIITAIEHLAENPKPSNSKKLTGRDGWRIRIGDYRVIYEIQDKICHVLVIDIGHRKEIYRS